MEKFIYTFLCASLAISVMAEVPRLSRSDFGHLKIIGEYVSDASAMTGAETVQSLQQFMRESNLPLNDNCLSRESPRCWSIEELTGAKIASADAYNFKWNESTGKPEIIETDYAMLGTYCKLTSCGGGDFTLSNLYGDFKFPIHIDLTTGAVTIEAGKAIATLSNAPYMDRRMALDYSQRNTNNSTLKYWTLYAMPLSRLMGYDNSDAIHGQVNEDSTISFNDDFAFLVCQKIAGEDTCTWSLSPIYRNLTLLNPNGTHKYLYTRVYFTENSGQHGFGHGGLVPRNTKPGSSKPVPGFAPINLEETSLNGNLRMKTGGDRAIDIDDQFTHVTKTTTEVRPVYTKQLDDSTLMVYNLYGLGNRCYMKFNRDGTIEIPRQQVYNDGLGNIYYGSSCSATQSQDSIMWGCVTLRRFMFGLPIFSEQKFDSNLLLFTGANPFNVPQEPALSYEEHDTSVKFYATTVESDGIEVILYRFDEEAEEYIKVENPLSVPRLTEPYWIHLAAEAYNPNTFVFSDVTYYEYEVPALDSCIIFGDVNGDTITAINDVTALIDYVLSGNPASISINNADCNHDGGVNISDITSLIDYLLSGEWPN